VLSFQPKNSKNFETGQLVRRFSKKVSSKFGNHRIFQMQTIQLKILEIPLKVVLLFKIPENTVCHWKFLEMQTRILG